MKNRACQIAAFLFLLVQMHGQDILINDVPAYIWHHGCVPTSAGMVIAYYDTRYLNLIPGSARYQNEIVNNFIASPGHVADYAMPMDSAGHLVPDMSVFGTDRENDCIADYLGTSRYSRRNYYGCTEVMEIFRGLKSMLEPRGYKVYHGYDVGLGFGGFCKNIKRGVPSIVTYRGHSVCAFGCNGKDSTYYCYNTVTRTPRVYHWSKGDRKVRWYLPVIIDHPPYIVNIRQENDDLTGKYDFYDIVGRKMHGGKRIHGVEPGLFVIFGENKTRKIFIYR